jgi:hypothetical protein
VPNQDDIHPTFRITPAEPDVKEHGFQGIAGLMERQVTLRYREKVGKST